MTNGLIQGELFQERGADRPRDQVVAALLRKEKWLVSETAYYLRCANSHVYNLSDLGLIEAVNIAADPTGRPTKRIYRDSVLAFEKSRREGAEEGVR